MLILAGVTINLTLGENGIFTTAQKATQNYTESQNKELSYLQGFTNEVDNIVNPAPLGTIIKKENNINYTADGAGNSIPVPVGFVPITSEEQGTKDTGFVIKNSTDGNEFVWVPVGNIANYKRVGWWRDDWDYRQTLKESTGEITRIDSGSNVFTETMPKDERDSVSAYGGFYIGRYETGVKDYTSKSETSDGTTTWTGYKGDNTTLVIQDEQEVWNWITRDKAKEVAEDLYNKSTNNVESKLCSSYAWDSALKFIEKDNKTYPTNSTGGNYNIDSGGTETVQPTGYHKVNNIYDMGGNTWEWTTESYKSTTFTYVLRGGAYNDSNSKFPAAYRGATSDTAAWTNGGFRVALYL